ncbi:MAG TPA: hypothetical protein VGP22_04355 [Albitalea sp.]|jgi:hypothetical protein|nr:hypothetical protein [Albitalea sp.]
MKRSFTLAGFALVTCAFGTSPVIAAAATDTAKAGERCEAAVADTVKRMRGRDAQQVEFVGAKRVLTPTDDAEETGVKGEGRYRGPGQSMSFSYSCAYNTKTAATSGVMFRETGGTRSGAEAVSEADIANVSPDACETATASLLKQKYPRVSRIAFGSDSRQLRPAPNSRTSLEGQGALQRAPGMSSVPFRYRCEFEGSGKVVNVQATD